MALLDRIPSPPSESARYPLRSLVRRAVTPKEVHWDLTGDFPLDQGSEGACVGFGTSAELSALPIALPTGTPFANKLYQLARAEDAAMGYHYPDGATVLGGLKAAKKLGLIEGYAWAQSFEDIRDAVLGHGSVVMGTDWLTGMDSWDDDGVLSVSGEVRGGHCWAIVGYVPDHPRHGELFELCNSWGPGWGLHGRAYVTATGLRALFEANGEAAIVTDTPVTPIVPSPTPRRPASPLAQLCAQLRAWFDRLSHSGDSGAK
jgi:hypothetical protein